MRKYGIPQEKLSLLECEYEFEGTDSLSDTVSLITGFYKDENGEVGKLDFSGELLLSFIPEYYKRKIQVCKNCKMTDDLCSCGGKKKRKIWNTKV